MAGSILIIAVGLTILFIIIQSHFHRKRVEQNGIETEATVVGIKYEGSDSADTVIFGYTVADTYYEQKRSTLYYSGKREGENLKIIYHRDDPTQIIDIKNKGRSQLFFEIFGILFALGMILFGIMV